MMEVVDHKQEPAIKKKMKENIFEKENAFPPPPPTYFTRKNTQFF